MAYQSLLKSEIAGKVPVSLLCTGERGGKFKSYTAKKIIELLKEHNIKTILDQLAFYKKAHKRGTDYQLWQEGCQSKLIQNSVMMQEKIDYIHQHSP